MDILEEAGAVVLTAAGQTLHAFAANWPYLLAGTLAASAATVYVGVDRISGWLRRRAAVSVSASVAAAVGTPFCSCGTTAVVLSMLATSAPWAPIVAFMVASPLTSPSELFLSAGLFGWPFAVLFFVGSIALGLLAGLVAHLAERAGLLAGQARFSAPATPLAGGSGIGPGAASIAEFAPVDPWKLRAFGRETFTLGRRMLLYFGAFAAIGYLVIGLVPHDWITAQLGGGSLRAILVAATLGIPMYVSTDGSLPLVASLVGAGMGVGPAMAFLTTGAGTSFGALLGALVIARWRVVGLVVIVLWVGAIGLGLLADLLLR
jgi:hypothetical protein